MTDLSPAGEAVSNGVVKEWGRVYVATYPMTHVDNLVKEICSFGSIGGNESVVFPPIYRYGEWDKQGTLMNQLDLLGEPVISKIK